RYSFIDKNVEVQHTYNYRLRQVDNDGTQSCETFSDIVTLTFDKVGDISLEQNAPNPFSSSTEIGFNVPTKSHVTLEVLDIFGNVVKTLVNTELSGKNVAEWDGTDNNNVRVSSGTYIYRMVVGDMIRTAKMTLVR
ncbi:MAG: FlgD immunoglobulin-like domain containing protein, partial [Bacteroidota bacterium]